MNRNSASANSLMLSLNHGHRYREKLQREKQSRRPFKSGLQNDVKKSEAIGVTVMCKTDVRRECKGPSNGDAVMRIV